MNRKITTSEFIYKARKAHGDKYNYSKVKYELSNKKVIITCYKHGCFEQTASSHLQGIGCPKCVGVHKPTTPEFIEKAEKVHGELYGYTKSVYFNNRKKVIIICSKHGDFMQSPKAHLKGQGCPECGAIKAKEITTSNISKFIKKAKSIHGGKYNYLKSIYVNSSLKIIITCEKHGDFSQKPNSHLQGRGCPKCAGRKLNTLDFKQKAKEIHGGYYDYSKSIYIKASQKVIIICPNHGEFKQRPSSHLKGEGCCECGGRKQLNTSKFIERAKKVHGERYTYVKVEYKKYSRKVIITCPEHGEFNQRPSAHLNGGGCAKCAGLNIPTKSEFIEKAKYVHGERYEYIKVKYRNSKEKVIITCNKHGDFKQSPNTHLQGSGCPKCNFGKSKGEEKVRNWLTDNNILFEVEKRFNNCKGIIPLPFDFFLPNQNTIIEYQGIQHYKFQKKSLFGGEEAFKRRKKRDKIKKDFAISNGFNFIEICYLDFDNVEIILKRKVNVFNLKVKYGEQLSLFKQIG